MKIDEQGGASGSDSGGKAEKVDVALTAEINGAIDASMEKTKKAAATPPVDDSNKDDLPPDETQSGEGDGGDDEPLVDGGDVKDDKKDDPPPVADDIIERAVKAGMSIADARTFQTADALGRVCDMLEKGTSAEKVGDKAGQSVADADPLAGVEDLDPEQWDEKLVTMVKGLKDVIRKQHEAIIGLKRSSETDGKALWFEGQVKSLGDEYVKALGADKSKRTLLEDKFAILQAGYKAAGKTVNDGDVFKDAVSLVLGDVQLKEQVSVKAKALADRRMKHIARPGGVRTTQAGSASADIAAEIDTKFFGRK